MTNIVWLRRDLQIHDNASINKALAAGDTIQPIFFFDKSILRRFSNKQDRRLSFLANVMFKLHAELQAKGGGLLVMYGRPVDDVPRLAKAINAKVFAGEDYEPGTIDRDRQVAEQVELTLSKQHLLLSPKQVLKDDGNPFKVFTPYSKQFRAVLNDSDTEEFHNNIKDKLADYENAKIQAKQAGLQVIEIGTAKQMLAEIGYEYIQDELWPVDNALERLKQFAANRVNEYKQKRDLPAIDFTSQLSPYLRFGLITPRQCYNAVKNASNNFTWVNELIWREFYAMILYHYPQTQNTEFLEKYRDLKWRSDEKQLQAWKDGQTGYPIVDAGMRQLKETGWMHNRMRMIVASFLTKDLLIDWRYGEEHFAQYLMDYEMASNVGGWQWAASVGTDAAPYFRVFNPILQSKKFDADGEYIRKYIPELELLPSKEIHAPWEKAKPANYPAPIVDRAIVKDRVMSFFKVDSLNS